MKGVSERTRKHLEDNALSHDPLPHMERGFTAQEIAAVTHTPGIEFAKTVVAAIDSMHALLVLPAHHRVDLARVGELLGAPDVRLANEDEMRRLFPDCEVGAEPPFGNLYGLPTLVSDAMARDREITFNAGTHAVAIRMRFTDFMNHSNARLASFSVGPQRRASA